MSENSTAHRGSTIRRYSELIVWRNSMALARDAYGTSRRLPPDER